MRHVSMKPILATMAFGALLAGCATTLEVGPGYYHYDVGAARPSAPAVVVQEPAAVYREPAVVYREPAVIYHEPGVVFRDSSVIYREPTFVYRSTRDAAAPYFDHAQ
jgi:hypothetical protein